MIKRYKDYGEFLKKHFGFRVQKLSVNAGFTCPNRDGVKAYGGCTYCNNKSFLPPYCSPQKSVAEQLEQGINFFERKKNIDGYLAYFQSHTNTYAPFVKLKSLYEEAIHHKKIVGLVISTRPDCVDNEILDYLEKLTEKYFISIEFGVESCNNKALKFINRCHTYEDAVSTIDNASNRGIHIGAHLILGLPFDNYKDCVENAVRVSTLKVDSIKFHHLQIIEGTIMALQYKKSPEIFNLFSQKEFLYLICDIIGKINPEIQLQRFINRAPLELLIAPKWGGIKNFEFKEKVDKYLENKNIFQGIFFK